MKSRVSNINDLTTCDVTWDRVVHAKVSREQNKDGERDGEI